jgi:hypothetical protein
MRRWNDAEGRPCESRRLGDDGSSGWRRSCKRQRIAPSGGDDQVRRFSHRHERRYDMSHDLSEKMKETRERAKKAIDREDDKLEQAARKAEPHLHEARERWAKAEREAEHPDEHKHD